MKRFGMIVAALAMMLGGGSAFARTRVQCNDGSIKWRGGACWDHGGVAQALPIERRGRPMVECRDGSLHKRHFRACTFHGGVARWL